MVGSLPIHAYMEYFSIYLLFGFSSELLSIPYVNLEQF